ncbi:MAG: RNA pseudouridine synthase [Candidatus Faecisoma sp.]|nr:RNA pseudouridine synthase [Acholeplasma sp.]MDY2892715.1 RNA pseudouridine synthase [Candidatus Faecisoma sp.]
MKIIYEDNHLLVVLKPINIPVQEDDSKDLDMLTYLKKYLKEKYNKPGNVYLGLVHRLDRPVSGIMVFAKTSKAASRLSEQIRNHTFKKEYMAVLCGKTPKKDILVDKLLKNPKTNTTVVSEKGKEAILSYELIKYKNNYSLVKINLETGRSHQIRVQFSSRGYPLYGDQRYNKKALPKQQIALFANRLEFIHPVTKEKLFFEEELPNFEPWNIFKR